MMKLIEGQIIGGTRLDRQGERLSLERLRTYCDSHAGLRSPINRQHDMSLGTVGFMENMRLSPAEDQPGEWNLLADLYCEEADLQAFIGGFSISFTERLSDPSMETYLTVYLPYPYYNDETLLAELSEDGVAVGKWVKKTAAETTLALITAAFVFFLKPVWEDFYKTQLAPHLYAFIRDKYPRLRDAGIEINYIQAVEFAGHLIEVHLLPLKGSEAECFSTEATTQAFQEVYEALNCKQGSVPIPAKIYLSYQSDTGLYKIFRTDETSASQIAYTKSVSLS